MKTALVATDLSTRSDRAVARAFSIAKETGARLVVITVIDEDLPEEIGQRFVQDARAKLETFCAAQPGAAETPYETRAIIGDPQRDLHALAEEIDASLVVLGLHRRRPLRDLLSGTTMERLVRASRKPVLLVRDPMDHPYRKAIVATDLSPAGAAAARAAAMVAPDAAIKVFHAYHVPFKGLTGPEGDEALHGPYRDEAQRELDAWSAAAALPASAGAPELVEGSVHEAVARKLAGERPDLLAIGAHGRSALSPTLLGSFTEELLRDPPCDLLVVRR